MTAELNHKKKPGIYYGYIVLTACFLIMTIVSGTQYSFGVFFKPMLDQFRWTRASTSAPFSLNLILVGLFSILAGKLSDKFGPRIVITVGAVIMGSGYMLMSRITNLWGLYLSYGIIVALGSSAMYVPLVAMMSRWFAKRRGLMVGISVSGVGFGISIVPAIASQLMISLDWRTSILILGAASLILIVLSAQFLRAGPETVLLKGNEDNRTEFVPRSEELSFSESAKTRQFWMIFAAWFLYGFFYQVGMVHIVPYATDLGMSALAAATILTIIGLIGILGRIVLGFTGDRFSDKNTLLVSFIFLAGAFVALSASASPGMIYLFAVVFGFFFGVGILLAPIAAEYFGFRELGMITGAIYFGNNIGGALGPVFAGYIFDITGRYELAFISSSVTAILAAIFMWLLKSASRRGVTLPKIDQKSSN